jgi:hypothetical protein
MLGLRTRVLHAWKNVMANPFTILHFGASSAFDTYYDRYQKSIEMRCTAASLSKHNVDISCIDQREIFFNSWVRASISEEHSFLFFLLLLLQKNGCWNGASGMS